MKMLSVQSSAISAMNFYRIAALSVLFSLSVEAFVTPQRGHRIRHTVNGPLYVSSASTSASTAGKGFGVTKESSDISQKLPVSSSSSSSSPSPPGKILALPAHEVKSRLLDLLPRMTGKAEEFREIESYVDTLEDKYTPMQTLGFFNMAVEGDWQLLFSTNRLGVPNTKLRLRELKQCVATESLKGNMTNVARWDLAEDGAEFDASGTFSVKCSYVINQGARMSVTLNDHVLELARGSKVPKDVPGLVGMLHRAMPTELFDPNELAIDTTYLDADMRIVRLTGSRFEGVRNIFIRSGSVQINPE